ncbi:MAG: hypothetical protein U0793_01760 [Gemmataceae bacterium]
MKDASRVMWLLIGVALGAVACWGFLAPSKPAQAGNDRYEDYILCTGPVAVSFVAPTDGIWLLDYRAGKLLGTLIDRVAGKIISWAEVDLVREFDIAPKQNVHFMMTTGTVTAGQAALYVAETTTGKFAIYTMGPRPDARPGVAIRRHDATTFRAAPKG